jgi:hypothetical protein
MKAKQAVAQAHKSSAHDSLTIAANFISTVRKHLCSPQSHWRVVSHLGFLQFVAINDNHTHSFPSVPEHLHWYADLLELALMRSYASMLPPYAGGLGVGAGSSPIYEKRLIFSLVKKLIAMSYDFPA